MFELLQKISALPFWSKFADFHGLLAMISLIFFGAAIILYFLTPKTAVAISWLKIVLTGLFLDLVLLDIAGLSVYVPYRAANGAKTILISSKDTAWLHNIIFEHKEFLAFAPPILIFVCLMIVQKSGSNFGNDEKLLWLRKSAISSLLLALVFVLIIAAEAVLVTKAAPI